MNIPATILSIFIIIGCFLPWVQMGALINNKGINNPDAIIILAASIVSLIISIATKRKWALLNLLLGSICGFVGVIYYRGLIKRVDASHAQESLFSLSLSMGSGLYFVLIGSTLMIIVSIIDIISGDKKNKLEKLQNVVELNSLINSQKTEEENPNQKVSPMTVADELKKYKELLDTGAITQLEYDSIKAKLLS